MPSAYAIREGTTLIAGYAFAWCENLVEITIPDSVIYICDDAFYECYNLTDVYYYLDEYEWNYICIGWNNDSLLSANIHYGCNPNGTDGLIYEIVGNNEYATVVGYEGYESDVVIPLQYQGIPVTKIAEYAFYGQYLNSVSIPNSVTTIGQYAFDQCHIENLYIGTGVTIIEYYAFWNASIYSTYIYDIAKWCQIDFYSSFDSNPLSSRCNALFQELRRNGRLHSQCL